MQIVKPTATFGQNIVFHSKTEAPIQTKLWIKNYLCAKQTQMHIVLVCDIEDIRKKSSRMGECSCSSMNI